MITSGKPLSSETKPLTFLLALTFLFLFSGCGQETVKQEYHDNGKLKRETHFKNEERDGLDTWFYANGNKMFEVHVKNGKAEGLRTEWYENGNKNRERYYKDGELDGLSIFWDREEILDTEDTYKDGLLIFKRCFDVEGNECECSIDTEEGCK